MISDCNENKIKTIQYIHLNSQYISSSNDWVSLSLNGMWNVRLAKCPFLGFQTRCLDYSDHQSIFIKSIIHTGHKWL